MSFKQPELPYALDGLAPFLSEEQMSFHYGKHQAAYFNNLNGLVDGKPEAELPLKELIVKAEGPVFNNAAQAWNHSFFWKCLSPLGGGAPSGELLSLIERDFGSFDQFKEQFSTAAAKLFGSGWTWLAADGQGKLAIMPLSNADTPLKHGAEPLLTLDVWEHAYYIDYRNLRPKFIEGFWDVVNWEFVAGNLTSPFQE
ncbi:MAG TPA: superoxide dismutase [Candidatus Hydrogenedentes bacterium]|nr:superoxide dismutase [Candidatus Hydrogenedentota bacterium]